MPELPEVETVCQGLRNTIIGKKITDITTSNKNLRKPINANLIKQTVNGIIDHIIRRAKYIIIQITNDVSAGAGTPIKNDILIHLGMSGRIIFVPSIKHTGQTTTSEIQNSAVNNKNTPSLNKHNHVTILFQDGSKIIYQDPRRFGFVTIVNNPSELDFNNLGPEPFDTIKCTEKYLINKFAKINTNIKTALLRQDIIAGIGNIYACEALFLSKIHPTTKCKTLKLPQVTTLLKNIREVLKKAITMGGTTLKDHKTIDGTTGYFQQKLLVYGRKEQTCPSCKKHKVENLFINNRNTFFCPHCQK